MEEYVHRTMILPHPANAFSSIAT